MPTDTMPSTLPSFDDLKAQLRQKDPRFWPNLVARSRAAIGLDDVFFLSKLRRAAEGAIPRPQQPIRIALLGACSLYPFREAVEHMLAVEGFTPTLFVGDFDAYNREIREEASPLYAFAPELTVLLPSESRCFYGGALTDAPSIIRESANAQAAEIVQLCELVQTRSGSEVVLANMIPPAHFDPGPYRSKSLASEWSFKKLVNSELGLRAPGYVHICDLEFLAARRGLLASRDDRAWFESKQPFSADLQIDVAREIAHIALSLRKPIAKVLVLDLDNTLWGGVIGDDGLDGIEIGDTSPRGEAFRAFQRHILSLRDRGILLAVCSKNDHAKAAEPFAKHPEMILRMEHFAAFYANWSPKSENLRAIAADLNLGIDSLVFVDDNAAEIDIVNQFVPQVRTILLGPDPGEYGAQLRDCRFFEPLAITAEDLKRSRSYTEETQRRTLLASVTDMHAYLASLEMKGEIKPFTSVDLTRIAQLINKSNQFNLTTIRRTEAEVQRIAGDPARPARTVRLADRFGDHGLISILVTEIVGTALEVDTWVMSCRVLNRQVEEEVVNELFRIARENGCTRVVGRYLQSAKNDLVRDLYPRLGFEITGRDDGAGSVTYERSVASFEPFVTKISVRTSARMEKE